MPFSAIVPPLALGQDGIPTGGLKWPVVFSGQNPTPLDFCRAAPALNRCPPKINLVNRLGSLQIPDLHFAASGKALRVGLSAVWTACLAGLEFFGVQSDFRIPAVDADDDCGSQGNGNPWFTRSVWEMRARGGEAPPQSGYAKRDFSGQELRLALISPAAERGTCGGSCFMSAELTVRKSF